VCAGLIAVLAMAPLARDMTFAKFKPGKNVDELIGDRSPGERPAGALLTTKPARKKPEQTALAKPILPDDTEKLFFFAAPTPEFDPGPINALKMTPFDLDPPGFTPPGQNSFVVPQGQPAPTPSAVPEPAMWVNFIVGFGLLGSQLRRRRKRADAVRQP